MTFRFVSNVDGTDFAEAVRDLDAGRDAVHRLVEDLHDARDDDQRAHARATGSLAGLGGDAKAVAKHFVAVSTNAAKVAEFGIDTANMFGFWDWVGGRYSMDSAIGLSTMLAIGPDNFRAMLAGFHEMDEHFRTAPFERNLPVLHGPARRSGTTISSARRPSRCCPYEQYLKRFPAYLQQLTMESNGKHVTLDGHAVDYDTGPIYWGEPGTNGQHSFYQLIHQGTRLIPCDFIALRAVAQSARPAPRHPAGQRLRAGRSAGVRQDGRRGEGRRHAGLARAAPRLRGQPAVEHASSLERLTPAALGKLVALYEHSVFTQGAIWNIDSFDQWGVELGKVLAQRIIPELESRGRAEARARQLDQRADPPLPQA